MKGYFAKYIPAVFFFSLFFIFLNAAVSFFNLQTLLQNERLINHSEEVILNISSVSESIKDAEINQRNYLISNQETYNTLFKSSIEKAKRNLAGLRDLVRDNDEQLKNVAKLDDLFNKRIALLEKRVTIFQESGLSGVQASFRTGMGIKLTQEITRTIVTMEIVEKKLLNARSNESRISANRTYTTILIATLFSIFLIFIIYYLIKRELDYRSTMEKRKDEFISIATHELKTPITSLQVFAQILQRKLEVKGDAEAKQYSTRIMKQVSRLTELINDLLDVSRLQLGKLKFEKNAFDLTKLVKESVDGLKQTTDTHDIVIKGKIKKLVYGDEDRVSQVMINLLSNAIKYSPQGKKIIVSLAQDLRFATVNVQDFGIGISDEHKTHVFERFYRAYGESEKNFPGLGMGLYICQEIIRRHRGKLWFVSQEGKGSTFSFTLPYAKGKMTRTQRAAV